MKSLELKSILVPTDFTEASDKALQHGIAIARHYRATLYVVYVVHPEWPGCGGTRFHSFGTGHQLLRE
jgi:nucleotide-binding universal stress UspA family protein